MRNNLLIFVILNIFSNIFSQESNLYTAGFEKDSVEFKIQYKDTLKKYRDTIVIKFTINNNSSSLIYIFDPASYYRYIHKLNNLNSDICNYQIYLLGDWEYNLGYENIIWLRKIPNHSKYEFEYYLIIENNLYEKSFSNYIYSTKYKNIPIIDGVYLNIGYARDFNFNKSFINDVEVIEFLSDKEGIQFEQSLNKFFLGPLWIKHY
jgi:hypothetical protein